MAEQSSSATRFWAAAVLLLAAPVVVVLHQTAALRASRLEADTLRSEVGALRRALTLSPKRRLKLCDEAGGPLARAPVQVQPLFKHMLYPSWPGTVYGDGLEDGMIRGNPANRVIVDVGLHDCTFLANAVRHGYVVHGFEPRSSSVDDCVRQLPAGRFFRVPIHHDKDTQVTTVGHKRPPPPNATAGSNGGFAYLHAAALGSEAGSAVMGVNGPYSSLVDTKFALRRNTERSQVPVITLDQAHIGADVWLLKLDVQGYEMNALQGAARLFASRVVAHVFVEYTPGMLRDAHVTPTSLIALLQSYGMVCFDLRGPEAPWSLSRDRPSEAEAHMTAYDTNQRLERAKWKPDNWQNAGAFDDLACVNVAKVWTATPPPKTNAEGWAPFSRCGDASALQGKRARCGVDRGPG